MLRRAYPFVLVLFSSAALAQQSSCPNTGFEDGNFTNWSGATGWCCPITCSPSGIINGRHTIMTGAGFDANTNNVIPVVAPGGGSFSARLGNDDVNNEAEMLSYSMTVDANNSLFLYRYAVVLQDPSHDPPDQPRFQIRMFDQNDQPIGCGLYDVTASAGIPGFQSWTDVWGETVIFKNWTTVGMDLSSYVGQTVTIEFATGDCSQGGHYGYAYIDCYCSPLQISSDFCPGLPTTTLEAPLGFTGYLWNTGETTSSITVNNPTQGQTFTCTLTSVTGCAVTLAATLTPSLVASGYGSQGNCMNAVQFTDNSQVVSGPPINTWHWDFGDGTTSTEQSPVHGFSTPGDHLVTLVVQSGAGCPDTLVQTINLLPSPLVDFDYTAPCLGEDVDFTDVSVMGAPMVQRIWTFGDGGTVSGLADPSHGYAAAGSYDVELYLLDQNGCEDSLTTTITVHQVPVVSLGPDQTECADQVIALNAGNAGSQFLWSTGQTSQTITPDTTADYWVVVTSGFGCTGTDTVNVVVNELPSAQLDNVTQCVEESVILDAGNPGCSYLWTNGQTTQTITISTVGGNFGVTVTTPEGCTDTDNAQIVFIPSVQVDLGPDQLLCDLEQSILDAGSFPNAQYLWSDGSTAQQYTVLATSEVTVQVTNGFCSSADTIGLVFGPLPVIPLVDTSLCVEQTLLMDAANPGCSYLWSTGETSQTIVVAEQSGSYAVVVTTPEQCVDSMRVDVTFIPSIELDLGPDSILCRGESLVFDVSGPNSTYQWYDGSMGYERVVENTEDLWVHVTNGYCEATDTLHVQVVEFPPHATVLQVDTCFDDPRVEVVLSGGATADHYWWNIGDTLREITVNTYGVYVIEAMNEPRCAIADTIRVVEFCPPVVHIPNTFTPNGDGKNDVFIPKSYNVLTSELLIFDRWGELIFETHEHDVPWEGDRSGADVPDGVYNYRYTYRPYTDVNGSLGGPQTMVGHVTVLR